MSPDLQKLPSWIDEFLFALLVGVAILTLIDWLIGEHKRAAMREAVGNLWLYLGEVSYRQLAFEDVRRARVLFERLFHPRMFSMRRLARCLLYSVIVTSICTALVVFLWEGRLALQTSAYLTLAVLLPNAVSDFVAIAVTIFILRFISRHPRIHYYITFIVLDILLAALLAIVAVLGLAAFSRALTFYLGISSADQIASLVGPSFFSDVNTWMGIIFIVMIVFASSVLPTLLFVIYALLVLLTKILRVFLRGPVMLVLIRFHESKQGVLTTFAVGAAALAKLVQEGSKYV